MDIVCPREPFAPRAGRSRGQGATLNPQPPHTYVGMPARKVRNVPAPMTSAVRFSPLGRPGITVMTALGNRFTAARCHHGCEEQIFGADEQDPVSTGC